MTNIKKLQFKDTEHIIIVSDTHLHENNFHTLIEYIQRIIANSVSKSRVPLVMPMHIILLGDIFDAFVGADSLTFPAWFEFLDFFKTTGHKGYFIRGNRDFLIKDTDFNDVVQVLDDEIILEMIDAESKKVEVNILIAHGDQWCVKDLEYMKFREMVRQPAWQEMVLSKSLAERKMMAEQIRNKSEIIKNEKGEYEDIDLDTLKQHLEDIKATQDTKISGVIHGHTHAGEHFYYAKEEFEHRLVLSSWENELSHVYIHDGFVGLRKEDYKDTNNNDKK